MCVGGGGFTHFLLLLLPGWIEQSFSFPLLFLFHVVVHRVVISILVHGCWHNPPTADRQRRLRRRSKRRDVDRDRWLRPANDLPTSLLLLLQALPASLPSNSGVQQPGCGWRSFLAAAPPSPVLLSTGQLAVICVSAMKEFSGEREGPGRHAVVGMPGMKAAAAAAANGSCRWQLRCCQLVKLLAGVADACAIIRERRLGRLIHA